MSTTILINAKKQAFTLPPHKTVAFLRGIGYLTASMQV